MSEEHRPPVDKEKNESNTTINLDAFIASLDASNPFYEEFIEALRSEKDVEKVVFRRKDKNILEIIRSVIQKNTFPLVDKKLGLIVVCPPKGLHEWFAAFLEQYHNGKSGSMYKSAEDYLMTGKGWYISAMDDELIVVGPHYRPDRYDREIFPFYKLTSDV